MVIPFNKPYLTGNEEKYVIDAIKSLKHCGNHQYCKKVIDLMKNNHNLGEIFLVPSGTAALEMGALLADLQVGDEVILPSYTFSSTANAIVLRGAIPVFCEVDPETMNIDVTKVEALITAKTKMIVPIDYAGIPCEIDKVMEIAKKYKLIVMHDTAQSYGSYYKGKATGAWADLATYSFHETKNITCGEGGALVVNRPEWIERAHFLQEKGTDRRLVLNGVKSKYHWVDYGSSFLLSDILAAHLYAQVEKEDDIFEKRAQVTKMYFDIFTKYQEQGLIQIPEITKDMKINHHAFWVIFNTVAEKEKFIDSLREQGVYAYIGYMPLHSAPMGKSFGYEPEDLPITEDVASRLVRMPFWGGISKSEIAHLKDIIINTMERNIK
ncbi:dTDP-4-amino-4,6-dideoxygalactose transaminase [bacterium]|nr:dTDP-4-amino-4,6-dideoxygalactose transaminase [bacterium]